MAALQVLRQLISHPETIKNDRWHSNCSSTLKEQFENYLIACKAGKSIHSASSKIELSKKVQDKEMTLSFH